MSNNELEFTCEICGQRIANGVRAIRVLAETCVSDGQGGGLGAENEVVFAVFHAECVASTYSARECDAISYILEAREVIDGDGAV